MKNRKKFIPMFTYMILLFVALSWLGDYFGTTGNSIPYSDVISMFRQEQVKEFLVEGDQLTMTLHTPYAGESKVTTTLSDPDGFRAEMQETFLAQMDSGILTSYDFIAAAPDSPFDIVLPIITAGVVLLFVWALMMGKMNNANPLQNFGKARTILGIPDNKKVTFDDVAGADEEKEELREVVDFLRNPDKFTKIGARIPHG